MIKIIGLREHKSDQKGLVRNLKAVQFLFEERSTVILNFINFICFKLTAQSCISKKNFNTLFNNLKLEVCHLSCWRESMGSSYLKRENANIWGCVEWKDVCKSKWIRRSSRSQGCSWASFIDLESESLISAEDRVNIGIRRRDSCTFEERAS